MQARPYGVTFKYVLMIEKVSPTDYKLPINIAVNVSNFANISDDMNYGI